eukprot:TRINITY_DN16644_c0_g4_i1.p1 TRINITY_DN16644_c0_g4~~TRINITY_DN16644_c0_g4_i1.p1  ORF type:complete len:167 (+),score=16.61 TRINITY_DN16644_c0_g4_i1:72-572(+)
MVGDHCQKMGGESIVEDYTSVKAMNREENRRAGKAERQAKAGYSSLDLGGRDLCVNPQTSLVPQPPPKRRPAGGKNIRRKCQSAPLQAIDQGDSSAGTVTVSAVPIRQTSGRAACRFRARILSGQVHQHRSATLTDFEPIACTPEALMELYEPMSELSDTDGEESS